MNEIVKYNNEMNDIKFSNFNVIELDLLMTICSKMREQGLEIIEFSFEQLKKFSNYDSSKSTKRFIKDLEKTYKKLINLDFRIVTENKIIGFVLFSEYEIDLNSKSIKIGVNPKFYFVLNELISNFTRFELKEFINLKSKYSKECYRRLKQFRKTGMWTVEMDEFRRILDIPEKYRMSEINRVILKTVETELFPLFKNLQIKKIKRTGAYAGRGNRITHIIFTFEKEDEIPYNVYVDGKKQKLSQSERIIYKKLIEDEEKEIKIIDGQMNIDDYFK